MSQEYFEKLTNMFKNAQEPLHAIAELNIKTLQNYEYMKPEDFSNATKPEGWLENQFDIAIANSHKALDCMQKSLQILEKVRSSVSQETKSKTDEKK